MYMSFQRDLNPLHPYQLQTFGEPVSWSSLSLRNTGSGTSMEKQAMQFTILLVLKIFLLWTGGMVQKLKTLQSMLKTRVLFLGSQCWKERRRTLASIGCPQNPHTCAVVCTCLPPPHTRNEMFFIFSGDSTFSFHSDLNSKICKNESFSYRNHFMSPPLVG